MTERLSLLLHETAHELPVPPPPTELVLARGRRERRRRTAVTSLAAAAVLAVVGGSLALAAGGVREPDAIDPMDSYSTGGAWSQGSTVYFGRLGEHSVDIEAKIKSMYYTSAGVVVRSGTSAFTDDAGPSHYALVAPDGDVEPLSIDLGDRVPGADPAQPYLAYAEKAEDGWTVVVRDVTDDTVVAQHPLPDAFTWGGWNAPPVALVGDLVHVAVDDATAVVNWRTGAIERPDHLPAASYPELAGDVYAEAREEFSRRGEATTLTFRRLTDGSVVTREHFDQFAMAQFSPRGTFAMVQLGYRTYDEKGNLIEGPRLAIYDMDTGERLPMEVRSGGHVGWTPDDQILSVDDETVAVCDPGTGECEEGPLPEEARGGAIKLAGTSYES
jgi:hypothetical protein